MNDLKSSPVPANTSVLLLSFEYLKRYLIFLLEKIKRSDVRWWAPSLSASSPACRSVIGWEDLFSNLGTPLPPFGSHGNWFYSTLVHTQRCLEESEQTYTTTDVIWGAEKEQYPYFLFKLKSNGWLHRTSKLHLDWISSSYFLQLLFSGTRQCNIQLRSHTLDMPADRVLSLLYHPFVGSI